MRKFAFSACVALAFLSVGWLGMRLAGDAEAEVGPTPAPATTTAKAAAPIKVSTPRKVVPAAPRRLKPWGERASGHCARSSQQLRVIANTAPKPDATEEAFLLGVLEAAVGVEERLLRELETLPVAAAERRHVREALRLLKRQFHAGEGLIASLRTRWDDALIERTDLAHKDSSERLVQLFLGLGATGCAAYQQG